MLHDGLHRVPLTHDAAIACGVSQANGQERQLGAAALRDQGLQGVGLGQWHIARQDHHHPIVGQHGYRLLHSVAGAQLRLLAHTLHGQRLARGQNQRLNLIGPVAGDDHGRAGIQLRRSVQHMLHQGHTRQALQHFGQAAFHAGAFAGGHDDHVDREMCDGHGVQTFLSRHRFLPVIRAG